MKYPDVTLGHVEAVWNKLGGKEGVEMFLRDELQVCEPIRWREKGGVIYFNVTSDGTTGENWITRLESKGFRVGDCPKQALRSPDFKPTSGVTTEVAVLKGMLFEDNDKPNAELACLIREKFTDKEIEAMGLIWIVAMHEPINNSDGDPRLLDANRCGDGRGLDACGGEPGYRWFRDDGFAFAVSHASSYWALT